MRPSRSNIIEGLISQGVNGLVVGPVSDKVGATILADAETAKIPVVFMQRPPGVDHATYTGKQFVGFVGTDDAGGGTTASQILYDAGARKWVAMAGAQGNGVSEARLKAANDFAAAHPDMKILQTQLGNEARDAGQKTMENLISALPGPASTGSTRSTTRAPWAPSRPQGPEHRYGQGQGRRHRRHD